MRVFGPGANTAERADVHDAPGAFLFHLPRGFLAAEKCALQIYIVNEVPIGFADVERIETRKTSGIVYQTIERPHSRFHVGEQTADFFDLREIGLKERRATASTRNFLGFGARAVVVNADCKAVAEKLNCDGAANA